MLAYGTRASLSEPPGLWGAMAEYMYLAPGSILHKASASIPAETAIIAGLVANGVQWLRNAGGVSVGDTVVIQGAGPQGLAATAVARACGAAKIIVTGLQRDAARLELARELGADDVIVADIDDPVTAVGELTGGRLADVVLDATGSSTAVRASLEIVRPQGTLVLAGLGGAETQTSIALDRLVWNEIRIQGVFSKDATAMEKGIDFLVSQGERYPLHKIVSHIFPLEEAERAIRAVGEDGAKDGFVKAAIRLGP
jgi:threonine dehydrogenase-like Zn-dependent dehydrogenase